MLLSSECEDALHKQENARERETKRVGLILHGKFVMHFCYLKFFVGANWQFERTKGYASIPEKDDLPYFLMHSSFQTYSLPVSFCKIKMSRVNWQVIFFYRQRDTWQLKIREFRSGRDQFHKKQLNNRNYLDAVRLFDIVCSCDLYNVITPKNKGIHPVFLVDLILADEKL